MVRFLFLFSLFLSSFVNINCGRSKDKSKKKNDEIVANNTEHKEANVIKSVNDDKKSQTVSQELHLKDLIKRELFGSLANKTSEGNIVSNEKSTTSTRVFNVEKLRSEDKLYNVLKKKYDERSKLGVLSSHIVDNYIISIRKEFFFTDNPSLKDRHSDIITSLFNGIKNSKIKAFSDVNLKLEISFDKIEDRMIKPVVLDPRRRRKPVQRYFKNLDVDNVEIIGNIFWSRMSLNMILDYLVVKIAIPVSKSKLDSEIVVCYFNYSDFINYLRNESLLVDVGGVDMNLADAIIYDKLNIMYTYISDNNKDYNLPSSNFEENNFFVRNLISKLENDFYSYNIPLR